MPIQEIIDDHTQRLHLLPIGRPITKRILKVFNLIVIDGNYIITHIALQLVSSKY